MLVLTLERPKNFFFKAGQYLWLVLPQRSAEHGVVDRRPFSISSGVEESSLELVIRITDSDYHKALRRLKAGDLVQVIAPFGSTFLPGEEGAIMISGGTGVSPFLSILRSRLPGTFSLYAFETKKRPLHCKKEILELGKIGKNQVSIFAGIPKKSQLASVETAGDSRPVFISGKESFVTTVTAELSRLGVKSDRFRYEGSRPLTADRNEIAEIFSSVEALDPAMKGIASASNEVTPFEKQSLWKKMARQLLLWVFLPILMIFVIISGIEVYTELRQIAWLHITVVALFALLLSIRPFIPKNSKPINIGLVIVSFLALLSMRNEPEFAAVTFPWIIMFPIIARLFVPARIAFIMNSVFIVLVIFIEFGVQAGLLDFPALPNAVSDIFILIFTAAVSQIMARIEEQYEQNLQGQVLKQAQLLKELKKNLRLSEMFTLVSQQTSSHVIITDHAGKILYANSAAERLTGYALKEMRGQTPRLWGGLMSPVFYQTLWMKKVKGESVSREIVNRHKGGRLYTALGRITPLLRDGRVIAFVATEEDISHLKEVDKAKTEFVSLASHQLRTPLSTIGWYSEMLLAGDAGLVTDKQKEYLAEIYHGQKRMTELVSALLNVSRLELGMFTIEPATTDIVAVGRAVMTEIAPFAKLKQLDIVSDFSADIPAIPADAKLLFMIYQNLLSNAVKYTPEGGKIRFSLFVDKKQDNVVCRVEDSGWGIPSSQQPLIFTKLFRADNIKDKDVDGTGLGLYIVKSAVDQAGGKIWFESAENHGTTFFVTFPVEGMKKQINAANTESEDE